MTIKGKHFYLIGIKGVGMTMLAQFLAKQGARVSGSDVRETFLTDRVLKKQGIPVYSPPQASNIPEDPEVIVYSSAYHEKNNPELAFIKKSKQRFAEIPLLSYAEALATVFNDYTGIAVCGSHGKTSVTAWLGYVLQAAGLDPNVLVGSFVPQLQGSARLGTSDYFLAEVDEYQNKLQYFQPFGVLLNNISYDHPDFFPTQAAYTKVFRDFIKKIPPQGFLVLNFDDNLSKAVSQSNQGRLITYGILEDKAVRPKADYVAHGLRVDRAWQVFSVNNLGEFKIRLSGRHSIYNALAVIATARELQVPLEKIRTALAEFRGTDRRAQKLGTYQGAIIIDDYAHHPQEIVSTLAGLRQFYPNKEIIVAFHPHTYTRTKALFADFVTSFTEADELIVLDIYGSAREKQGGTSSRKLVTAIAKHNQQTGKSQRLMQLPGIAETAGYLKGRASQGQVIVLMGAGDVFRVAEIILNKGIK